MEVHRATRPMLWSGLHDWTAVLSESWGTNLPTWQECWTSTLPPRRRDFDDSADASTYYSHLRRCARLHARQPTPGIRRIIRHRGQASVTLTPRPRCPKGKRLFLRKAYGGPSYRDGEQALRGDVNLAWPSAEIAVMGPEGAVNILFREELSDAEAPDAERGDRLTQESATQFANPYVAASRGFLDDVMRPRRPAHASLTLEMLADQAATRSPPRARKYPTLGLRSSVPQPTARGRLSEPVGQRAPHSVAVGDKNK